MISSTILAQFYGVILAVTGLGLLMNRDHFHKVVDDMKNHAGLQLLMALVNLFLGAYLVLNHNVWLKDWTVILTIIGWLLLFNGVVRSLFPSVIHQMLKTEGKHHMLTVISCIVLIIGLVLIYFGFNI